MINQPFGLPAGLAIIFWQGGRFGNVPPRLPVLSGCRGRFRGQFRGQFRVAFASESLVLEKVARPISTR